MEKYYIDGEEVKQIQLPRLDDPDPRPRLIFNGRGIHAGDGFAAWIPGKGFTNIWIEMDHDKTGPQAWYIANKGMYGICPVGLWCLV